ncbi:hypothetical protein ACVFYP_04400 [Roseomonas sp. F4]
MTETTEPSLGKGQAYGPIYTRRLSDKILIAFHQACDQDHLEVARMLLECCEMAMRSTRQPMREQRRAVETLCAAHERLWLLRNPDRAMADYEEAG